MSSLLQVRNLRKSFRSQLTFKKTEVLKGLSFELRKNVVTGFIGANGAGKTTTLKCLLGLVNPDSGEINFFNQGYNTPAIRTRIGFLPERPYFYEYLSGVEFLFFYGHLSKKFSRKDLARRVDELLELVELTHARKKSLREYSKGMLQRIGLAQALLHKPEFVILDEPMSGLDPDGRVKMSEILREGARIGTSLFFSSHLLNDAESLCEDLVILKEGLVIYNGTMKSLLERLQIGFSIQFRLRHSIQEVAVESESALQKKIDELREKSCEILEIKSQKPSLESAFIQLSRGGLH